jgi:hypothetical protein
MRTTFATAAFAATLMLGAPGLALAQTGTGTGTAPHSPGMMQQSHGAGSSMGSGAMGTGAMGSGATATGPRGAVAPSGTHDPALMGQSSDSRPGSGTMQHSMAMDENELRNLLRDQGYSDIESVSRDGDNFRVGVTRNGRPTSIVVDAYTGTIRNQSARR